MRPTSPQSQSDALVRGLAEALEVPVEAARHVYEAQYHLLEREAHVKTFLPVLAARHAREVLLRRQLSRNGR